MNLDATRAATATAAPAPLGARGDDDASAFADVLAAVAPAAPAAAAARVGSKDAPATAAPRGGRGAAASTERGAAGTATTPTARDVADRDDPGVATSEAASEPASSPVRGKRAVPVAEPTVRVDPQLVAADPARVADAPLPGFAPGDPQPTGALANTAAAATPAPRRAGPIADTPEADVPAADTATADPLREAIERATATAAAAANRPTPRTAAAPDPDTLPVGELAHGDFGRLPLTPGAAPAPASTLAQAADRAADPRAVAGTVDPRLIDPKALDARARDARTTGPADRGDTGPASKNTVAESIPSAATGVALPSSVDAAARPTPTGATRTPASLRASAANATAPTAAAGASELPAAATATAASDAAARMPAAIDPGGPAAPSVRPPDAAAAAFAAALAPASNAAADAGATAPAQPLPSYPITVPFGDPRFTDAMAERVTWLVREGMQSAELTLHPQDLGPIRIDLTLDGASASIAFSAQQADTRGAIEQSLPRLREMLASQGLHLGGASVDAGGAGRGDASGGRAARDGGRDPLAAINATIDPVATAPGARAARAGRIDVFA